MSAEVTFLPPPATDLSFSNPTPTNSLPPFASLQSPSLSCLPYLTDETWLNINTLLSQPPPPSLPGNHQNPPPTPQPSQIRKRRDNHPIRHPDPLRPSKARDDAADRRKRENFLARNRRAATKCRERKREFTKRLQREYEEAAWRKHCLEGEFAQLQKEVLELKNELLRHSQCADPAIQNHLAGMVQSVTVAQPPAFLAASGPTAGSVSEGSSGQSVDEDRGSSTVAVSSCETARTRRDSVLSASTDASLDSLIDDGLFEEIFNFA